MKKIKSLISFVLMAAMMLTLIPAMGLNAMAADAITNLYFADNIVLDFDAAKTEYTVVVPWSKADGYVLPELKWEPKTADVTVTGNLDSGALTVTDGTKTYTINLSKVGENMYANGGGESGTWQITNVNNSVQTDVNPGAGNYCINIDYGVYYPDKKAEEFTGQRTYLASSMVRKSSDNTETGVMVREEVKNQTNNANVTVKGWNSDGTERTIVSYAVDTENWLTHYRTYYLDVDASFADIYTRFDNYWTQRDFTVDEYFIGELVVSDVKVTDANGLRAIDMAIPEENATINLSAVKLNQLGNQAGLGSGNSAATWSVLGNPEGITVADGVVTIAPTVAAGTYAIEAEVETGIEGGQQTKAKGVYTISLFNPNDLVSLVNDVTFSNVVVDNFSKDVFVYNVPVPVLYTDDVSTFKYDVPKLTDFELADCNDTVVVTEATEVPGTTTINVTHDDVSKTYTFNFYLAGNNMYENGGAEIQSWVEYGNGNAKHIDKLPYKGSWAMEIQGSPYYPDRASEVYVKDRVYLASSAIRRSLDETVTLSFTEEMKRVVSGTSIKPTKYDEYGNARTTSLTLSDYNWVTTYRTYVITDEDVATQKYADIYWTASNGYNYKSCGYDEDEKFMGELVANTIVKDSENNVAKELFIPSEDTVITLTAEKVNNLGNKAGLGAAIPTYTWSVVGNPAGITVNNGTVTVTSDVKEGTYYVEATAPTGIANGRQVYTKNSYEIKLVDESDYIGTLTSLKVSNTDIDFAWDTYEYDVKVPVLHKNEKDSYTMPKVTAAGYKGTEVEITYPDAIPGDITVEVADGKTYTISLDFVGTNMYSNPGFEVIGSTTGTPTDWSFQTGLELANDGDTYANAYQVTNKNSIVFPVTKPTLEVGKMYIHQNLVRKADEAKIELHKNDNQRDYVKMRLDGKNGDGIYTYYNADGTTNNNDFVQLTENWHPHIATMYEPTTANEKFCNIYVDWSNCYRYAIDDFWLSELTIADIEFDADKEVLATSSALQTVNLTAKAVNSVGNLAGIKDNHTLTFRLGNGAPEGAVVTADGQITVPANFKGTFEVEAVATPTWQGAAQKNFVKAFEVVVSDAAIWYEATDDGVVANLIYTGNETGYKFINAIYNVLSNGELEFVTAYTKDVDGALTYAETITLNAGQVAKTFFWKWDDITPLTKSFTFTK